MTKKISTLILVLILLLDFSGALLLIPQKAEAAADLTFLQTAGSDAATSETTFSSQNLGTAATDRIIFVIVHTDNAPADNGTVTVQGISTTKVASTRDPGDGAVTAIYWANVPTGTTGDIVVTFSAGPDAVDIGVFRATGIGTSITAYDTATDLDDVYSMTIDVPDGGILLAGASASDDPFTTVGVTESYDQELPLNGAGIVGGIVVPTTLETNRTVSFDATVGGPDGSSAAVSFAASSAPDTPTNLAVSSVNGGNITLTWTEPDPGSSGILNYAIYRDTTSPATTLYFTQTSGTSTETYTDTAGAQTGAPYFYRVTATNSAGTSTYSNGVAGLGGTGRIIRLKGGVRFRGGVRLL